MAKEIHVWSGTPKTHITYVKCSLQRNLFTKTISLLIRDKMLFV